MESAKILLTVVLIIGVFMANFLYGVWFTRRSKKEDKVTNQSSNWIY